MGIFNQPRVISNSEKIADMQKKAEQLRAAGMFSSAERIEKQLRQYKPEQEEKVKPLSPKEIKKQIAGAKATGQAK